MKWLIVNYRLLCVRKDFPQADPKGPNIRGRCVPKNFKKIEFKIDLNADVV